MLAALAFVKRLADEQLHSFRNGSVAVTTDEERAQLDQGEGHITLFEFGGPPSYGAATNLGLQVHERTKDKGDAIMLDFSSVPFMDVSAARAVEAIVCEARHAGKSVYVTGMQVEVRDVLAGLNADHCLPANTRYAERVDALRAAVAAIPENELRRPRGGKPKDGGILPAAAK